MSVWNEVVREIESLTTDIRSLRVTQPPFPESVRLDVESVVDFQRAIPLDELIRRGRRCFGSTPRTSRTHATSVCSIRA